MTTTDERAALRAKAEAATQGEWYWDPQRAWLCPRNPHPGYDAIMGGGQDTDGEFIAAASPEPVLGLLDEIAALQQRLGHEEAEHAESCVMIGDIAKRNQELQQQHTAAMAVVEAARRVEDESMDEDTGRWMTVPMKYWLSMVDALDALAPAEVVPS